MISWHNHYVKLIVFVPLLLILPLIASLSLDGFNWTLIDFLVMGLMLLALGSAVIFLSSKISGKFKPVTILLVVLCFLLLWAELAVGMFTQWGN